MANSEGGEALYSLGVDWLMQLQALRGKRRGTEGASMPARMRYHAQWCFNNATKLGNRIRSRSARYSDD